MSKDISQDFLEEKLEYMMLSFLASNLKVLIVGGGKAGFTKAKSFVGRGCKVTVVSEKFSDFFNGLKEKNLTLQKGLYNESMILKQHLVVIATDNQRVNEEIIGHCEKHDKLFLTCDDFKKGSFVVPTQRKTDGIHFGLNTIYGSPKTASFLADKMQKQLGQYDEFVSYCSKIRMHYKNTEYKNTIMSFVNSEDFYQLYQAGKHEDALKNFYSEISCEIGEDNYES